MLPTLDQARKFKHEVDRVRAAFDLSPLQFLDFDGAEPGSSTNCLSARNLFAPLDGTVGTSTVLMPTGNESRKLARVLDTEREHGLTMDAIDLPTVILRVTDPFDNCTPGLRDLLVEAGVVA